MTVQRDAAARHSSCAVNLSRVLVSKSDAS
jgi:hypothetical protein